MHCENCGIKIPELPEDASYDERICDKCHTEFEDNTPTSNTVKALYQVCFAVREQPEGVGGGYAVYRAEGWSSHGESVVYDIDTYDQAERIAVKLNVAIAELIKELSK
jgi:hypothetical protein